MAGRIEPSKSSIMSQTNVKSISVSTTESVLTFVGRIFIMLSMNWKPLTKLADDVSVVGGKVVLVCTRGL
jgi:hypothetical protein